VRQSIAQHRELSARVIATNKDTGKVVGTNLHDQPDVQITAAPLAVKDKIIIGAAGGDRGCATGSPSSTPRPVKCSGANTSSAPGEPGSETWKDKNNAWQVGGGAMWITVLMICHQPGDLGTGNPVPMFDPTYRPGDNLYTDSMIVESRYQHLNWYFQYLPNDMWDYDEAPRTSSSTVRSAGSSAS
jgi:alcohol dehydrogenase (cytochrome c)